MPLAPLPAMAPGDVGISLVAVVVVGISAQWLASRARLPSILLLLLAGILAGPEIAGVVDPDEMLGDLLFPVVSLAVGILLFEGGLHLRFRDLGRQGVQPVARLVTIGAAVTWLVGSVATSTIVGLEAAEATLVGAILVVSGPTVIIPLLRYARVRQPVNDVLRWEGIVIDPIGATVAVAVMRGVLEGGGPGATAQAIAATAAAGMVAGLIAAALLTLAFNRHWVPDELHNAVTLAAVLAAFAGADLLQPEAGLFATTSMGVALGNQRFAPITHIQEFEENLGTLILSGLFVLLGARIELNELAAWAPEALGVLAALVLIARPAAVWASTVGSGLTRRERLYLTCVAPRGIVAVSVSTVFALELARSGRPVEAFVPVTVMVIVGTVVLYGLAARPAARWLHVAKPEPRGVVLFGGPPWARELGAALSAEDVPVLVVTRDQQEAAAAADRGLLTYTERPDAEDLRLALDMVGARLAIATSDTQELNAYGVGRAIAALGRANVYYLPRHDNHGHGEADAVSRRPFGRRFTQAAIAETLDTGGRIVTLTADDVPANGRATDGTPDGSGRAGGVGRAGGAGSVDTERPATGIHGTDGADRFAAAVPLATVTSSGVPVIAADGAPRRPPEGYRDIYLLPPDGTAPPVNGGRRRSPIRPYRAG